ncbi:MAG: hypothetical protein WBX03_11620, partial [Terriglobales bacterium]
MLPTLRTELEPHAMLVYQNNAFPPSDVAELRNLDASDVGRHSPAAGSSEEQFVVVAAVQGEFERDPFFPHPNLSSRNRLRLDLGTHMAFLADVF